MIVFELTLYRTNGNLHHLLT